MTALLLKHGADPRSCLDVQLCLDPSLRRRSAFLQRAARRLGLRPLVRLAGRAWSTVRAASAAFGKVAADALLGAAAIVFGPLWLLALLILSSTYSWV